MDKQLKHFISYANRLVVYGAFPLWVLAFLPETYFNEALPLGFFYSATLLSFLGGINWWQAVDHTSVKLLSYSLIPVILSNVLYFAYEQKYFYPDQLVTLYMVAFLAQYLADYQIAKKMEFPEWFLTTRTLGSMLVFAAFGLLHFRFLH